MEECCKYEPIIVDGKYVGGNIIYCDRHVAVDNLTEALYQCFLWMKTHQRDGPLSPDSYHSDSLKKLLDQADVILTLVGR